MKKTLLVYVCFYLANLSVIKAQSDSSLSGFHLNVGGVMGFTQLHPETPATYAITNYAGAAMMFQAAIQQEFSKNMSYSIGFRYGTRNTNSSFSAKAIGFYLYTYQKIMEVPVLLGYTFRNRQREEFFTLEGGIVFGVINAAPKSFYRITYYQYPDAIPPYEGKVYELTNHYYAGLLRLSRRVHLSKSFDLKFFGECVVSTLINPSVTRVFTYFPESNTYRSDPLKFNTSTFQLGIDLSFNK